MERLCDNNGMENARHFIPTVCPSCRHELEVTRLQCPACGTEVAGHFGLGRLASLPEPHASLIDLFLRMRGNMKDMERALGLSYPTVRARLEEALVAAGYTSDGEAGTREAAAAARRTEILAGLQAGEITAAEAATKLRELKNGGRRE